MRCLALGRRWNVEGKSVSECVCVYGCIVENEKLTSNPLFLGLYIGQGLGFGGWQFSSWPLLLNGWTVKIADIRPGGPIPGAGLSGVRWQCPFSLMVTESRYFVPVFCLELTPEVVPDCHVWHLGRWLGPGLQPGWFGPKAGLRPG